MTARTFPVRSALSRQISRPGGKTLGEAVAAATTALETKQVQAMATISTRLTDLETLCADPAPADLPGIYDLAAELVDLAGYFDTGPLYTALYSLCDISQAMLAAATWAAPAIQVHVRAARLILADGCRDGETSRALLAGLSAVSERYGARA